jgi:hypothetical protein
MRPRGRPFPRGLSGNPGGRPKELRDVIDLARTHSPAAITTLAKIMRNEQAPPAARIGAATAILDRGYGKPGQSVDITFKPWDLSKLTDEQLDQLHELILIVQPESEQAALPAPSPRDAELR